MYDLLILGHIFGATTLVGGRLLLHALTLRATSPRAPRGEILMLARQAAWVGPRVFLPASAVLLGSGAGLMSELHYQLGDLFILVGLVILLAASGTGPLFLAPESRRIGRLIEERGSDAPEVDRRLRRIFVVSRVEMALLLVALVAMVLRPSL